MKRDDLPRRITALVETHRDRAIRARKLGMRLAVTAAMALAAVLVAILLAGDLPHLHRSIFIVTWVTTAIRVVAMAIELHNLSP